MTEESKGKKETTEQKKPGKDDKELSPEELARVTGAGSNANYYSSRKVGGTDPTGTPDAGPPAKGGS